MRLTTSCLHFLVPILISLVKLPGVISVNRSFSFENRINDVAINNDDLIVIGEGFVKSLSINNLASQKTIFDQHNCNYTFLASSDKSFMTCYRNTSHTGCFVCSQIGSCNRVLERSSSIILRSHGFMDDREYLFISSTLGTNKEFISKWNNDDKSFDLQISLLSNWTYEVANVMKTKQVINIFSKCTTKGTTNQYVSFSRLSTYSKFNEQFVNTSTCGTPITSSILIVRPKLTNRVYYIGNHNKLCTVVWEEIRYCQRNYASRFIVVKGTTVPLITSPLCSGLLVAEEVTGISGVLLLHESVSSAVVIEKEYPDKLLLLATNQGRIIKFAFDGDRNVVIYKHTTNISSINDGRVILKAWQKGFVFGYIKHSNIAKDEIFKAEIHDCMYHRSCSSCFNGDPYCRWFPLEHKCRYGMEGESDQIINKTLCPKVRSVNPKAVPAERNAKVTITLNNLNVTKLKNRNVSCVWYLQEHYTTVGQVNDNAIDCPTPIIKVNLITETTDVHLTLTVDNNLAIEKNTTIKFYYCGAFRSCVSCQARHFVEDFNCVWSSQKRQCSLRSQSSPSLSSCSQLKSTEKPIRIPNQMTINVTLSGERLNNIIASEYKCIIDDQKFSFHVFNASRAQCSFVRMASAFDSKIFERNAILKVYSKKSKIDIDDQDGKPLTVIIYECNDLSCTDCLIKENEGNLCLYKQTKCRAGKRIGGLKPPNCGFNPQVNEIDPPDGPLEGGTLVTISGNWLGINTAQLKGNVFLARVPCKIENVTKPLESFDCITSPSTETVRGNVSIWNFKIRSSFSYKKVSPSFNVTPNFCFTDFPQSFNISIKNLYIGKTRSITVNDVVLTQLVETRGESVSNYRITCPKSVIPGNKGKIVVKIDKAVRYSKQEFEFVRAPSLKLRKPATLLKSIESGGVNLTFPADNANRLSSATATINVSSSVFSHRYSTNCRLVPSAILCPSPNGTVSDGERNIEITTLPDVNFTQGLSLSLKFVPDPKFVQLNGEKISIKRRDEIFLRATQDSDLTLGASKMDYTVMLGEKECNVTEMDKQFLTCSVSALTKDERKQYARVVVFIGSNLKLNLGVVTFNVPDEKWKTIGYILSGVLPILIVVGIIYAIHYKKRRDQEQEQDRKEREEHLENLQAKAANAARKAFGEMQTAMTEMRLLEDNTELPYRSFEDCMIAVLISKAGGKKDSLAEFECLMKPGTQNTLTTEMVTDFNARLLSDKSFMLTLIRTLDATTKIVERSLLAAAISIVLSDRMDFYYGVVNDLFQYIVRKHIEEKKADSLLLLFRRSETLMEKLFSNWLTISLFDHLKNSDTGRKLYILFKTVSKFQHMGPVDECISRAKNVLSEEVLLSEDIEYTAFDIKGSIVFDADNDESTEMDVQVLSCDTMGQVKEKIIETLYPHEPYSKRPSADHYVLQWKRITTVGGNVPYYMSLETGRANENGRLKTIGDYNDKDILVGSHLVLIRYDQTERLHDTASMSSIVIEGDDRALLLNDVSQPQHHLCRTNATANPNSITKDFFLQHLLKTKLVIIDCINDLFKSIFNYEAPSPYVQYTFNDIDQVIEETPNDKDKEMLAHLWKSNSYILRVWVNLLKNPEFLFDVSKSEITNANLSVIAQALMDACSYKPKPVSPQGLSSTKLVFHRDMGEYRKWVVDFYSNIKKTETLPPDQEMSVLYNKMQQTCKFSGNIIFVATRFLFLKSRELKTKIISNIDDEMPWFRSDEERRNLKEKVEMILVTNTSTCTSQV